MVSTEVEQTKHFKSFMKKDIFLQKQVKRQLKKTYHAEQSQEIKICSLKTLGSLQAVNSLISNTAAAVAELVGDRDRQFKLCHN